MYLHVIFKLCVCCCGAGSGEALCGGLLPALSASDHHGWGAEPLLERGAAAALQVTPGPDIYPCLRLCFTTSGSTGAEMRTPLLWAVILKRRPLMMTGGTAALCLMDRCVHDDFYIYFHSFTMCYNETITGYRCGQAPVWFEWGGNIFHNRALT